MGTVLTEIYDIDPGDGKSRRYASDALVNAQIQMPQVRERIQFVPVACDSLQVMS
jgi:hypothetical protein